MDPIITVKELKNDPEIQALLRVTEVELEALGYTEHSNRHASIVSKWAGEVLAKLGGSEHEVYLAGIAGYLHDIGNAVNRHDHAQSGALLAYQLLVKKGMCFEDAAEIMLAIGNHDEQLGDAVSRITAALILADKADVHKSRVRKSKIRMIKTVDTEIKDIHDRVNFAAESSHLDVDPEKRRITLDITVDLSICSVMDYFEIYFSRMSFCRKAADLLGCTFSLKINNVVLL